MGGQIALKLGEAGINIVATDVNSAQLAELDHPNIQGVKDRQALVRALGARPIIWLMIPHQYTDTEIEELLKILPRGAIIIDGGNSNWRDTRRRGQATAARGVKLIDAGTSGGIHGLKEGFCIMVGGDKEAVAAVEPIFEILAQEHGYAHVGAVAAGHFVKMVHNGIEYGLMQSYAEGYHLLREGQIPGLDLAQIAALWQHGSVNRSWLNELIAEILTGNPALDAIDGRVSTLGEADWTVETAKEANIPVPVIAEALKVRKRSQAGETSFATRLLAAMRNKFGGHDINPNQ